MLGLTSIAVWNTGKVDSPLLNLFLLVVIFSALTLGKLITLLELCLITSIYLLAAFSVDGTEIFRYEIFSRLMLNFAPFVLVAYVTSLLAADLGFARAQVELMAETDELTGLSNMRAFNHALLRQERVARKHEQPLAVLMIDIDNLKAINDNHGHDVGNEAIRTVATAIKDSLRTDDVVARFGGDEFIALLPRAPESAARRAGERILARVAEHPIDTGSTRIGISVSIGLAASPVMAGDAEELMRNADQALYASKKAGRNRLSTFKAELQAA
jgi:diguanylate cyclase (GGDEF)-like protein